MVTIDPITDRLRIRCITSAKDVIRLHWRSLIDRVILTPAADVPDGIDAQLHGDLPAVTLTTPIEIG